MKKGGFNLEASELFQGKAIRKLSMMMLETIIKLFTMKIAYSMLEETDPTSCFSEQEIEVLELQIKQLEGKTEKLKNPYNRSDLKRYTWAIARIVGWKGYLCERNLHNPLVDRSTKNNAIMQGWILFRDVSGR